MEFIARFFGFTEPTMAVNIAALDTIKEDDKLEAQREAVKARMATFGRKSLLEGGEFSRWENRSLNNKIGNSK